MPLKVKEGGQGVAAGGGVGGMNSIRRHSKGPSGVQQEVRGSWLIDTRVDPWLLAGKECISGDETLQEMEE